MKANIDNLQPVDKQEALRRFRTHIEDRQGGIDPHEKEIYERLEKPQNGQSLVYYSGNFSQLGVGNLVLPHHAAEKSRLVEGYDREVQPYGEPFREVIDKYRKDYIPKQRFPLSLKKIYYWKQRFSSEQGVVLKAGFLLISDLLPSELKGTGQDDEYRRYSGAIYLVNGFHRFVAYGLWIAENGFRPLEVYCVTATGT